MRPFFLACVGNLTNHSFINGIRGFIGEDAGRQARYDLLHLELVAEQQYVIIDQHVFAKEI